LQLYNKKVKRMENPFKKETHNGLIAAIVIGGVAAAALAYLFLTEDGEEMLEGLKHKLKEAAKDMASGVISDKSGISKNTVKKTADVVVK
jgi:gas vesicle protein